MTPPLTTVNVTAQATLLYGSQGSTPTPMQVINTDATHTVWVGNVSNITAGGTNAIPVGAGASVGFDGSVSVYGVTATGVTVAVAITPGGTGYSPGTIAINGNVNATVTGNVNVANTPNVNVSSGSLTATVSGPVQIEPTAGQPLDVSAAVVNITTPFILPGNKANLFQLGSAQAIAANSSFSPIVKQDIRNYASCDISLAIHCATQGTLGASLTSKVSFLWYDDSLGNNLIYQEDWFVWVANASILNRAFGTVPMRGQYLTVSVVNPGTVGISLDAVTITGTYRTPVYSSFRQEPPNMTVGGVTVSSAAVDHASSNNLASINNQTPGTGLQLIPLPLYAGPVSYYWRINTAQLVNVATLIDMSFAASGSIVAGTSQNGLIKALTNTISTTEALTLNFPRSPVGLVINPAATSSIEFGAIGQQGY